MKNDLKAPDNSQQPTVKPTQDRDTWSDDLKALAIIGVVCIHAGFPYADIFRFCVPIFVILWAFYYEQGLSHRNQSQVWAYVTKRFIGLAIPYTFWTAVYIWLFHAPSEWITTPIHTIVGGWMGGYGWSGQYFFIILFQLTWLMPLLRLWVNPSSLLVVLITGAILNIGANYLLFGNQIISGIGDRLFIYWLPYLFLGVASAQGYPPPLPWLLPFAIVLFMTIPQELTNLHAINNRASSYLILTAMIGSISLFLAVGSRRSLVADRSDLWLRRAIRYIGKNSFVIFVSHPLFLEGMSHLNFGFLPDMIVMNLIGKTALVTMAIAGSLALGWTLRRVRLSILIGG